MRFTQFIFVTVADEAALEAHLRSWSGEDAASAPGFLGSRLLRDRDQPGRYVIEAEFASVEESERNDDRPETQQWAARLYELIEGEAVFANLDVIAVI